MNRIDLEGRIAVVTGAGRGIGRACAETFLDAGASVALWDLDPDILDSTAAELAGRGPIAPVRANVSDEASVAAALEATMAEFGRVDILLNSAGNYMAPAKIWDYSLADFRKMLDLHLVGMFLTMRAVLPGMMERNYGRICNLASVAGKEGNPEHAPYSAAKAGIISMTKCAARETATFDISINAIAPETVKTRIVESLPPEDVAFRNARVPRGRFVELKEITAMIAWMVSAENSYTTGATFDLTGGRSSY